MFLTVAIVKHVQNDDDYGRFYAQAEVTLTQDVDRADLQLSEVHSSVHAIPLMNAKAGLNTIHISGNGSSPFKVGDTIRVICLPVYQKVKRPQHVPGSLLRGRRNFRGSRTIQEIGPMPTFNRRARLPLGPQFILLNT
jgi:hypothetical protein